MLPHPGPTPTVFAMNDASNVWSSAANGTAKGNVRSSLAQYLLEWLACMKQSGSIKLKRRSRRRQDIQKTRRVGSLADYQQHILHFRTTCTFFNCWWVPSRPQGRLCLAQYLLAYLGILRVLRKNLVAHVDCLDKPCQSQGAEGGWTDDEEPGRGYSWAREREPQWSCTPEHVCVDFVIDVVYASWFVSNCSFFTAFVRHSTTVVLSSPLNNLQ